ncbi:MAG: helix-turn-helix domain-containing protein [Hyphomicrobiaceae bacterium]|nr:helix-turn-helix domain-containing protein [Hyphomicrobiaceae bacterium]
MRTGAFAKLVGVSVATVHRAVKSGKLIPAEVTEGGHFRFDLEDAEDFLCHGKSVRRRGWILVTESFTRSGTTPPFAGRAELAFVRLILTKQNVRSPRSSLKVPTLLRPLSKV